MFARIVFVVVAPRSSCQAATAANVAAKGVEDPRTQILCRALQLRDRLKELYPKLQVFTRGENVSSMTSHGPELLSWFSTQYGCKPSKVCSANLCGMRRSRFFWHNWDVKAGEGVEVKEQEDGGPWSSMDLGALDCQRRLQLWSARLVQKNVPSPA